MSDYHSLLTDVRFLGALFALDRQIAERVRVKNCGRCGGRLHWANYPRSPRGVLPSSLVDEFSRRLSLCCGGPECRKRATPPSVSFLGRRQYIAVTFVVLSMLRHGVTAARARALHALVPVDDRTLQRWREWWCREFPSMPFWRAQAGAFAVPVDVRELPASLVTRFIGGVESGMTACLRFLSALSTRSCPMTSGLVMAP